MQDLEKQMLQSQVEIHEVTLNALSKELHDNVGQMLSSAKMLLGVAAKHPDKSTELIATTEKTLSEAIHSLRTLSKTLDKDWISQFSLIENLLLEKERNSIAQSLQIHLHYNQEPVLANDAQVILFRIIQEAIQNTVKHANACNLYVDITEQNCDLNVTIKDDGRGFDITQQTQMGMGINNIKNRTDILGGNVEWQNNEGTTIRIHIPNIIAQ
ncbi:MAG: hypothetical protein JST82_01205 [Bacteroidetes bacterium]|nr:hypothetical protein [Bacteroidota bacterium]